MYFHEKYKSGGIFDTITYNAVYKILYGSFRPMTYFIMDTIVKITRFKLYCAEQNQHISSK